MQIPKIGYIYKLTQEEQREVRYVRSDFLFDVDGWKFTPFIMCSFVSSSPMGKETMVHYIPLKKQSSTGHFKRGNVFSHNPIGELARRLKQSNYNKIVSGQQVKLRGLK